VNRLLDRGFDVICLVRHTSSREKIKNLRRMGAKIYYGDITKKKTLEKLPSNIEIIYHLAALQKV
jgi:nucleoside-diphosphate-sugar epimerase